MNKQRQILQQIISGRYSRTSNKSQQQQKISVEKSQSKDKIIGMVERSKASMSVSSESKQQLRLFQIQKRRSISNMNINANNKNQEKQSSDIGNDSENQHIKTTLEPQKDKQKQQIKKMLQTKYRTFMKWDYRKSLPGKIRLGNSSKQKIQKQHNHAPNTSSIANFSMIVKNQALPKDPKSFIPITIINNKKSISLNTNSQKSPHILHLPSLPPPQTDPISPHLGNLYSTTPTNIANSKLSGNTINNEQVQQTAEMHAIKSSRRQRFLKLPNPMQFLKHYMEKQNYIPSTQQKHLIQKLIVIQKSLQNQLNNHGNDKDSHDSVKNDHNIPNLQSILENIYKVMNLAVDYNQLLFLSLLVCLAADICYYLKDYPRSFYFYNQTRIAGTYSHIDKIKIPAIMGMGRVLFQLHRYDEAKRLFKKGLQYAWRNNDENTQLQVYDLYGKIYNQKGNVKMSYYYHQKYAKNLLQPQNSALRKISKAMLGDHDKHVQSLQDANLSSLFLQYVHLPLDNTYQVKTKNLISQKYKNYDSLGNSPRMSKQHNDFSRQNFPDIHLQLKNIFEQDYQFRSQIPDPDKPGSRQLNRLFNKTNYITKPDGNKKREIQFVHSIQYNKIIKKKHEKPNLQKQFKRSLQQQVQTMLKERLDPDWYEHMVSDIKKRRKQKVGSLKQKIRNSHQSYNKYPNQRKKQSIWASQKINQSFNRTLLDLIDPIQ